MAGQTLATFDAVLKDFYGPGVVESLNQEVPFLALLEKESNPVVISGRRFLIPIHLKRNSGVGARPELGTLPTAGNQGYADYTLQAVNNYGVVSFSGQTIAASRNDKGAFGRVAQLEMDGLKNDLRLELNWQFQRNGKAARATIASGASSATQTVNAVYANILQEGMVVDIYDSTITTPKATGLTIQSVTIDPKTFNVTAITLSQSVTTATGDVIVRSGNVGYEITGLDAIVGNGTYGGINPANYAFWQSPVLDNGGTPRALTEDLFQRAIDVAHRAGGGQVKFFFTTPNVRRNYFNQLATMRRVVNTIKYDGGFTSLEFEGKEIFVDDMAIPGVMFGIDPEYVKIYETDQMGWMDDDGTILHRDLTNKDAFYAVMRWYSNLGCTKRSALVKVTDLQES
jgi:hypothetical protein